MVVNQGDIVEELDFPPLGIKMSAICTTPACDLVTRKGAINADYVAFCPICRDKEFFERLQSQNAERVTQNKIKSILEGKNQRYCPLFDEKKKHFFVIDYQMVMSIPFDETGQLKVMREATSPFKEYVASRYGAYMGRIGIPDLPLDVEEYSKSLIK